MTAILDTLAATESIVDAQGRPSRRFQQIWQNTISGLEEAIAGLTATVDAVVAAQAAADAANAAAVAADAAATAAQTAADTAQATTDALSAEAALNDSYVTGLTLTATDAGANATITISAHTRVYGDGTSVAVSGGSVTGLAYSTDFYVYYDDPARTGGAVSYQATTNPTTAAQTGDRHTVGGVTTPAALGAPEAGGGVRPPGVGNVEAF